MARTLAPGADVLAVQYPGRQDRRTEQPLGSVQELAERITEVLMGDDDRPLALFGHSMGAMVGYEVALRLEETDRGPAPLPVRPARTAVSSPVGAVCPGCRGGTEEVEAPSASGQAATRWRGPGLPL